MTQRIMPETTEARLPNSMIEMSFPEIETAQMEKGNPTMLPLLNFHTKTCTTKTVLHIHIFTLYIYRHTLKNYKNPRTKKLIPQVTKAKTDENPLTNTYQKFRNKLTFDYLESYFFVLLVVCLFVSCSVFELFLWPKKSEKRN